MQKTTIILLLITLVSKGLGFLREIILSYYYGASNISDAYLMSLTLPGIIFTFIAVGLNTNYIPLYTDAIKESEYTAKNFTTNLLNSTFLICTGIIVLGYIFMEESLYLFAPGFDQETINLTIQFTKINLFSIYFTAIVYIFSGYLQVNKVFIIPALISIPFNFLMILGIYLSGKYGYIILSVSSLLAVIFEAMFLYFYVRRKGYRYNLKLNIYDPYLKKILFLSLPVILGVSVNQINTLVDKTLASRIGSGAISALNYSDKLILAIQSIFVVSIITVVYPKIARLASNNNTVLLKKEIRVSLNSISLFLIPISMLCIFFSVQIIEILFGRGKFDTEAIIVTSQSLFFYSLGMLFVGWREVLSKIFYVLKDTKTPMINAAITMILNIILNLLLYKKMGVSGLAFATSISSVSCTILLYLKARKTIGDLITISLIKYNVKVIISSLLMVTFIQIIQVYLFNSANYSLIISIFLGVIIYTTSLYAFNVKEVKDIIGSYFKINNRR